MRFVHTTPRVNIRISSMTKHTKEQIDVARRSFNRILDILKYFRQANTIKWVIVAS